MRSASEVLITNGCGFWSKSVKEVTITGIELDMDAWDPEDGDPPFGELRVHFDTSTWDVNVDGLIYTDDHWLADLKDYLTRAGYNVEDVDYSEYGMQGDRYVSLDAGEQFINSWKAKA